MAVKKKVSTKKVTKKADPSKPKRTDVGPGRPPKEHQFKKGQSGNPLGPFGKDPLKHELKQLTSQALKDAIEAVVTGTEEQVVRLLNDPGTPLGHKVVLRATLDAAQHGHWEKFNSIIERVLGRVPDNIHIESPKGTMSPAKKIDLARLDDTQLAAVQKLMTDEDN